jgi:hypothetical protein
MPPSQKVDRIRALWRTVRSSGSSMSADAPDADERELALGSRQSGGGWRRVPEPVR